VREYKPKGATIFLLTAASSLEQENFIGNIRKKAN
jgi:hypothetical protein